MSQQMATNDVVRLTGVVNKPKLTTLLYGATGLLFLFLIVRVFAVTSLVTTNSWHLQVEEARPLVVSLDPTDLFSIVTGTLTAQLAESALVVVIAAFLIALLELPPVLRRDSQITLKTGSLSFVAAIAACVAWELGSTALRCALFGLSAMIISYWSHTLGVGGHAWRRAFLAEIRSRRNVRRRAVRMVSVTDDLVEPYRKCQKAWIALSEELYATTQLDEPSLGRLNARYAEAVDAEIGCRLVGIQRFWRGYYTVSFARRRVLLRWRWSRQAPNILAFVALIIVLNISITPNPWVPEECFQVGPGNQFSGYRLKDSGSIVTILTSDNRKIHAIPTNQVTTIAAGACPKTG